MNNEIEQYRAGFEAWARSKDFDLAREGMGYLFGSTDRAWAIWIASKRDTSTSQASAEVADGACMPPFAAPASIDTPEFRALVDAHHDEAFSYQAEYRDNKKFPEWSALVKHVDERLESASRGRAQGGNTSNESSQGDALDAQCWRYIEEHATTHGGGHGFTITCFVPVDHEDMQCGILAAISAHTKAQEKKA